jgi:outer membrane protein OmpA-like peptidoglycan-associated protein
MVVESPGFTNYETAFMVPLQTSVYDLHQAIALESLRDAVGETYAQKATVHNAFFNTEEVIMEKFPQTKMSTLSAAKITSMRNDIMKSTDPIEIIKYVNTIEVSDMNGTSLADAALGLYEVEDGTMKLSKTDVYNMSIKDADANFKNNNLVEARAGYIVASDVDPSQSYPNEQLAKINAQLASTPALAANKGGGVSVATIKGAITNGATKAPMGATIKIYDKQTGALVDSYTASASNGNYDMKLTTGKDYRMVVESPGFTNYETTFMVPLQTSVYDLHQAIALESLRDEQGRVYAQQAVVDNAFFNMADAIKSKSPSTDVASLSIAEMNKLNAEMLSTNNPASISNYGRTIVINDVNGRHLASAGLGAKNVNSGIKTMSMKSAYDLVIENGAILMQLQKLADARANYVIADLLDPSKTEAQTQIVGINARLSTENKESLLAESSVNDAIVEGNTSSTQTAQLTHNAENTNQTGTQNIVFRNILFDFDSDDLRKESVAELVRVSNFMKEKPAMNLQVDGHTDWIGSIEYNLALSERRARRAYYFVFSEGINEGRLTYQFFGESLPIAPNANADGSDNPEGRQQNRRVEFKMDQDGTADNVILRF